MRTITKEEKDGLRAVLQSYTKSPSRASEAATVVMDYLDLEVGVEADPVIEARRVIREALRKPVLRQTYLDLIGMDLLLEGDVDMEDTEAREILSGKLLDRIFGQ